MSLTEAQEEYRKEFHGVAPHYCGCDECLLLCKPLPARPVPPRRTPWDLWLAMTCMLIALVWVLYNLIREHQRLGNL